MRSIEYVRTLSTLLIASALASCCYKKVTHLNEDELKWVECYDMGDTVLFNSNKGNIDTLAVFKVEQWNERHPLNFGETPSDVYEAGGMYMFTILHQKKEFSGTNAMRKIYDEDTLKLIFYAILKNRSGRTYSYSDRDVAASPPIPLSKLGINPEDYVVFDDANSNNYEYSDEQEHNKIVCFIFSKHHGLEYYKFEDGEEFTRISDSNKP